MLDSSSVPVRYLRAVPGGPVPFEPDLLASRVPLANPALHEPTLVDCTYDQYLLSIRQFIQEHIQYLRDIATERGLGDSVVSIDIITEKHGADYHPARIVLNGSASRCSLVANVAITQRGKERLTRDYLLMDHLRERYATDVVPKTYVAGETSVPGPQAGRMAMTVFLAEWFDGFHEFHLSSVDGSSTPRMVLWNMDGEYVTLDVREEYEIFRNAARILTILYDTDTLEEVFPWHHASGDFVARVSEDGVDVRLITVRQYAARVAFPETNPENSLVALALFLANLTIRMRLDRLDGVGDVAWAGDHCVDCTFKGFLDGMQHKVRAGFFDPTLLDQFVGMLRSYSLEDLAGLFQAVIESYDPAATEVDLVRRNLVDHIILFFRALREILS